jgi:Fe-S cluster assembly protein SufD
VNNLNVYLREESMETMMQSIEQQRNWYLSLFQKFEKSLNGQTSDPFHTRRRVALQRFVEMGFPTTHDEEWKYTDLAPMASTPFQQVLDYSGNGLTSKSFEPYLLDIPNSVVLVDGFYSEELSQRLDLPPGVRVESLSRTVKQTPRDIEPHLTHYASLNDNSFVALGTAFLRDGVVILIPDNTIIQQPIHILYLSTVRSEPFVVHPRILVVVGNNCQLSLLESYIGLGDNVYLTNAATELMVGENSVVEHDKLQQESNNAFHISTVSVLQKRSSTTVSNNIILGGSLTRNNIKVVLDGEGAEATLNGLYLGTGARHIDNHTTIDHAKPHCNSHELYKGILSGRSRGVFNGKIFVRKDAQKTDAKQTNKNLILSDEASIDTKPQLEIFANDVKCTHGATVGQLEEEALFYLRSRGLSKEQARDILIYAFASDVIDRILKPSLRVRLHELVHDRLASEHTMTGKP